MAAINPPKESKDEKRDVFSDNNNPVAMLKPSPTEIVNLNLSVSNDIKIEYKVFCAQLGKSMNSVFSEMFDEYKRKF